LVKSAASKKRLFIAAGIALLLSLPVNFFYIRANIYALSPQGNQEYLYPDSLQVILLSIVYLALFACFGWLFERIRHIAIPITVFGFAFLLFTCSILILSDYYLSSYRRQVFQNLAEQSQTLVNAIHEFERTNNVPPDNLQQLVPEYISEIPQTGIGAYPNYCYRTLLTEEVFKANGNQWILYVDTPRGGSNNDLFIYLPLQNYPEKGFGGDLEKIDNWAYVHE